MERAEEKDRRVRRTRKLLKQGLRELLQEKEFSRISAQDITERMDLNRGTFYLHFSNTTALLSSLGTDLLEEIAGRAMAGRTPERRLMTVFQMLAQNRELCAALYGSSAAGTFMQGVSELLQRCLSGFGERHSPDLSAYMGWGLTGLAVRYLQTDSGAGQAEVLHDAEEILRAIS